MSNAALPGLALLTSKPMVSETTPAQSGKTAAGPAFGTALNKAVEAKPAQPAANTSKTPTTADAAPAEQAPVQAEQLTDSQTVPVFDNKSVPESVVGLPSAPLDVAHEDPVSEDPMSDDLTNLPNLADLPAPQVEQVAVLPATIDPSAIPGLVRSTENAKDFTPADNVAGSAVMAAIQLSKTMEQRGVSQVNLPVGTPKELKDMASPVQAVDAGGDSDALPAGIGQTQKVDTPERAAQNQVLGAAPAADRASPTAPAPVAAPASESAAKDVKLPPAPTVDTNSFTPTPAPVLGSTNATPATTPPPTLAAPVASHEWNQGLGQQLVNMHLRGDQSVDLHLHPADLGPISINLRVDSSQAQVQFFSHNANVRSAIEQALPQLKEVLAQEGIALGQTSVGDQRQQQASRDDTPRAISTRELGEKLNLVEAEPVKTSKIQTVTGQISTYA